MIRQTKTSVKLYQSVLTIVILLGSQRVQAASEQYCEEYAQSAVAQQISNLAHGCNQTGRLWSGDFVRHKSWCKTVPLHLPDTEELTRRAALDTCNVPFDNVRRPWAQTPEGLKKRVLALAAARSKAGDQRAIQVFRREGVRIPGNLLTANRAAAKPQTQKPAAKQAGKPAAEVKKTGQQATNRNTAIQNTQMANRNAARRTAVKPQPARPAVRSQKTANRPVSTGPDELIRLLNQPVIDYYQLRLMLQRGAHTNSARNDAGLPLTVAIKRRDLRSVQELLRFGRANPNLTLNTMPPLTHSLLRRANTISLQLIQKGANVNVSNKNVECSRIPRGHQMPLDIARRVAGGAVIRAIQARGGRTAEECLAIQGK